MNLKIKLVKSPIGYAQDQKDTIKALGLRKIGQEVLRPDNAPVRGMVFKVKHLVSVEETK